jgi:sigma-B regulation protein RsbU (phosphoserine phosphatase)
MSMWPRDDRRWIVPIWGALLMISGVRLLVHDPFPLGLALPSVGPIILAAYCFGRRGALLAAATATVLFPLPTSDLSSTELTVATVMRGLVFFGTGLLVAELFARATAQEAELDELRVLREALTPSTVPDTPGWEVATAYVAAESQVAGDFFLVTPGTDGRALLAVGDAVGHGVAAARRASYVRAVLATLAGSAQDPAKLLELANTALLETDPARLDFITVLCAAVDGDRVTWASAGHPPPWDLDTGAPFHGPQPQEPLGVSPGRRYESVACDLRPGQGVLMFSDGLTEARRAGGGAPLYGEAAAREELRARRGQPPEAMVAALREAARRFAGGRLADDLCLLAARRT